MTNPPFERPAPAALPQLPRRVRKFVFGVLITFIILFIGIPWLAGFFTDWLWFGEVGFRPVFITSLIWRFGLFFAGGVIAFAIFYGNVKLARGNDSSVPVLFISRRDGMPVDLYGLFKRLFLPAAFVISFIMAISAGSLWMTFLKAIHGAPVGTADSLFGRDIGFYLFKLPAVAAVLNMLDTLVVFALVAATVIYWIRREISYQFKRAAIAPHAAMHLGALVVVLFLIRVVRLALIDTAGLLQSTTGPLVGASYTDVHIQLPGIYISIVAALVAAALVIYGIVRG